MKPLDLGQQTAVGRVARAKGVVTMSLIKKILNSAINVVLFASAILLVVGLLANHENSSESKKNLAVIMKRVEKIETVTEFVALYRGALNTYQLRWIPVKEGFYIETNPGITKNITRLKIQTVGNEVLSVEKEIKCVRK